MGSQARVVPPDAHRHRALVTAKEVSVLLQIEVARIVVEERLRDAQRRLLPGGRARSARDAELSAAVSIRRSRHGDEAALERLAALDSRTLPDGSFLLAEVGGELVAAVPLEVEAEPLGNPFRPTAEVHKLLERRARRDRVRRATPVGAA
jgi:hypothetical protein